MPRKPDRIDAILPPEWVTEAWSAAVEESATLIDVPASQVFAVYVAERIAMRIEPVGGWKSEGQATSDLGDLRERMTVRLMGWLHHAR